MPGACAWQLAIGAALHRQMLPKAACGLGCWWGTEGLTPGQTWEQVGLGWGLTVCPAQTWAGGRGIRDPR